MSDSTTTDIFLSTATGNQTSFDTEPVALGADNGAMFEVRLKAGTLTATGVRVTLQASNDGQNWTPYPFGGATTVVTRTNTTAPRYQTVVPSTTAVVPYRLARLNLALTTTGGSTDAALVDVMLRTYRKA